MSRPGNRVRSTFLSRMKGKERRRACTKRLDGGPSCPCPAPGRPKSGIERRIACRKPRYSTNLGCSTPHTHALTIGEHALHNSSLGKVRWSLCLTVEGHVGLEAIGYEQYMGPIHVTRHVRGMHEPRCMTHTKVCTHKCGNRSRSRSSQGSLNVWRRVCLSRVHTMRREVPRWTRRVVPRAEHNRMAQDRIVIVRVKDLLSTEVGQATNPP